MGFPGTWMTESESVVYRVVPKCACSTIGQIMYYSDHGEFFDGDIHDSKAGLHKWSQENSRAAITQNVAEHRSYAFTCVRNPYTRILSSFFDKNLRHSAQWQLLSRQSGPASDPEIWDRSGKS